MRFATAFPGLFCAVVVLASMTACSPAANSDTDVTAETEGVSVELPDKTKATDDETSGGGTALATEEVNDAADSKNPSQSKVNPNGVTEITFDDIDLPIDADMVFRPFMMTERAQSLDGQRVRISGFMLADSKTRGIKQFILVKNTECKFGPGGQADHLVNVNVNIENGVVHQTDAVAVEGVITVNPYTGFDGNTWSIFDLACDRIEKFKPRR